MRELIVHQQIPKTATTSVVALLRDTEPSNAVEVIKITSDRKPNGDVLLVTENDDQTCETWRKLNELPEAISALSIMAPWGFQKALRRPIWAFTLVREPLARISSYWNFACKAARSGKPSFAPFLDSDFNLDVALTRMISLSFFNEQTRMISGSKRIWLCSNDLQRAKDVIGKELGFVGLVENFDSSTNVLLELLGSSGSHHYRLNSADGIYDFRLDTRQTTLLAELNEWDIKLYRWINSRKDKIMDRARASRYSVQPQ
jgi:hypothetical protein